MNDSDPNIQSAATWLYEEYHLFYEEFLNILDLAKLALVCDDGVYRALHASVEEGLLDARVAVHARPDVFDAVFADLPRDVRVGEQLA